MNQFNQVRRSTSREPVSRRRRGASMTEYIIIVGLIGFALVSAIKVFSWRLEDSFFLASLRVMEISEKMDSK